MVIGYSGAIYKKFDTEEKAVSYIKAHIHDYAKPKKVTVDNSKQTNITKKEIDLKHKIYQQV